MPQADIAAMESLTAALGGGYVLIYPGTTAAGEIFPTEGWLAILKDFQQRQPELPLVLVQTPATASQTAALTAALPGLQVITPETIGQTAALIAGANLLVSIDSYPLALAAALKVYALGLFGKARETSVAALDPGENDRLVAVVSPTGSLADIPPDKVLKQIWSEEA
ncbi:MAG: glycosyltransferase family 9 protein [Leptolyngbyaceae cyanobacterium SM2_3_12]|nr:glycosyltransferase family 9 protein [Leptolyngbyaceae cyanobacterium SM2_3_12]